MTLEDPELELGLLLCQAEGLVVAIPGFASRASYSVKRPQQPLWQRLEQIHLYFWHFP